MWAGSGTHIGTTHETHTAYWQPTWDPYEAGGQKLYGAHMGGTVGKMWKLCAGSVTHMGNGQPTWEPYKAGGQKPYGPHMIIIIISYAHICPIWLSRWAPCVAHVCVLAGLISKSFSK